jgi:hypothetical protein
MIEGTNDVRTPAPEDEHQAKQRLRPADNLDPMI